MAANPEGGPPGQPEQRRRGSDGYISEELDPTQFPGDLSPEEAQRRLAAGSARAARNKQLVAELQAQLAQVTRDRDHYHRELDTGNAWAIGSRSAHQSTQESLEASRRAHAEETRAHAATRQELNGMEVNPC